MATLQTHYLRMLRLDGAGCRDEIEAARALGMTGSPFPAKKALAQTRKLGAVGVARAVELLADADLDLRGKRDLPGDVVLEMLVARLARLGATARFGTRR
jgi:DNA polymerase III subunit delta